MRFRLSRRRLRTLGRFSSGDPWNGNRPTEFSIEEYVMMPQGSAQAADNPYNMEIFLSHDNDQNVLHQNCPKVPADLYWM